MIVDAGLGRGSGVSAVEEILRAGLSHTFSSAAMLLGCGCANRMRWLSANRSGKLNSPEPLIQPSLLPCPRKSEKLCGSGNGH
jgi:hypothetical protein